MRKGFILIFLFSISFCGQLLADEYYFEECEPYVDNRRLCFSYLIKSKEVKAFIKLEEDSNYTEVKGHDFETDVDYASMYGLNLGNPIVIVNRTDILQEIMHNSVPSRRTDSTIAKFKEVMKNSKGMWNGIKLPGSNKKLRNFDLDFSESFKHLGKFGYKFSPYTLILWEGMIYNTHDFGNLIWGATMRFLGFNYYTIKIGSEINEMLGSWRKDGFNIKGDSKADQLAIKKGYYEAYPILFKGFDTNFSIYENMKILNIQLW